jgi:hypothetical protein
MSDIHIHNPFKPARTQPAGVQASTEASRQMAEVQATVLMAKKFPRDEHAAFDKIMKACQRNSLAEQAIYSYPRGGQVVKGPSIRLAEVLARAWGNIDFGIREIEQVDGHSIVQAYCWDIETNVRDVKEFTVKHERHTKNGTNKLRDPRDIYEMVANNGARRLRACILSIIPGDVVEAAVIECNKTLARGDGATTEDRIRNMIRVFSELGVTKEMLEQRLGHPIDQTVPDEIADLTTIYRTIKDNYASRQEFFGGKFAAPVSDLNDRFAPKTKQEVPAKSEPDVEVVALQDHSRYKNWQSAKQLLDNLMNECGAPESVYDAYCAHICTEAGTDTIQQIPADDLNLYVKELSKLSHKNGPNDEMNERMSWLMDLGAQ